jgi:hypothetical protein
MRRVVVSLLCALLMAAVLPAADKGGDYAVREKGGPKPEAKPDKASVYIVRPAKLGMAIRIWAFADDTLLGLTKGQTYTHVYLDPGTYVFWARAENVSAIEYTVDAGETYYFKQKVKMGGLKARVKAEFLSEDEGLAALKKCKKYSTLTEAGKARGEEIATEKYSTAQEKAAGG